MLFRCSSRSVSNVNTPASETKKVEVNGLLALLQGTIDAGVNGGTKLFCEAFLTEGYIGIISIVVCAYGK